MFHIKADNSDILMSRFESLLVAEGQNVYFEDRLRLRDDECKQKDGNYDNDI